MNRTSILTKTGKGLMEATGKTSDLSRDLRNLLKEVDGKVSVGQLQMRQELFTEQKFMEALGTLERDGYVREITPQKDEPIPARGAASKPPGSNSGGADLDFTAIASRTGAKSASDISRQIAAERERVEAAAKAKAEAESRAKAAAYESGEKSKREELDRVHRDAEARAKAAADEKAKREAEERARHEAEARAKKDAEARAKKEAEDRARKATEEKARYEAEERARREAEERARREAEERERHEETARRRREEEKRKAEEDDERRRKEEDRRRWEIEAKAEAVELEEQIRRENEKKARKQNDERVQPALTDAAELEAALRAERAEAEERDRQQNEERVRREEEERRRQEEESKLRLGDSPEGAEAEIRRREEEMRRREKEEAARAKAEAKARTEADAAAAAQARKDAQVREKVREDEDQRAKFLETGRFQAARAGKGKRRPRNVGRPMAVGFFFILVISLVVLHFVPIDSAPYERAAQEWLGQPVKIGTVNVALVPSPHLRFERITIGKDPQMRIATARGSFSLLSIFDDRKAIRRLELEGATVPQAFLSVLFASGGGARGIVGVERISGKGIRLDLPGFSFPELNLEAVLDSRGALGIVKLANPEGRLNATLEPRAGRVALEMSANMFALPIGKDLAISELTAKGTVGRNDLAFSEFEGRAFNGTIQGNARLRWVDGWALDGEFSVRQMDAARIAAPIVASGTLEGKAFYGMKAAAPDKLFESARMEGRFTVQKGSITNVDMTRILQGSSAGGGTTLFSELNGSVLADSGRIQVRQLHMAAGLLQGAGSVDVDSQKNLSGRVQIELRAQMVQARATLAVSGNLQNPQFRRTN
jgi:hypothetical protein